VLGVGDNLLTFLANRLSMSFTNLGCQNFGLTDPVTVVVDGAGAATAATFNTTPQTVSNTTGAGAGTGTGGGHQTGNPLPRQPLPKQSWRRGYGHHRLMDPSRM
jgi:hypothetical protein